MGGGEWYSLLQPALKAGFTLNTDAAHSKGPGSGPISAQIFVKIRTWNGPKDTQDFWATAEICEPLNLLLRIRMGGT